MTPRLLLLLLLLYSPGIGIRSRDCCKMFDDIVLLDDRMVAEGKDAGREDGRARGFKEGEGMGRGKGFQTAAEMGFCRGCCLAWLSMHAQDPGRGRCFARL